MVSVAAAEPATAHEGGFLRDEELVAFREKLFKSVPYPPAGDWYGEDSPIQPASVDLHVGSIYEPGAGRGQDGDIRRPHRRYRLKPGQTAFITTAEEIQMPDDHFGLGFTPTSLAATGVLTPTVGHIDPGYKGPLRIVAINMGRKDVFLTPGVTIATVVIYRFSKLVHKGDETRRAGKLRDHVTRDNLRQLSRDFALVEERAGKLAQKAARKQTNRIYFPIVLSLFAGALLILAMHLTAYGAAAWLTPVGHVKALEQRIESMERRLGTISEPPAQK